LAAEREQRLAAQRGEPVNKSVQAASNQWYNQVPEYVKERGREWRKNESQIKGLRSFNNWIKSALIHKFSPEEKAEEEELGWGEEAKAPVEQSPLRVLDIGCGKGGDLQKWQNAPQQVGLYVGLDPAETSIEQANDRFREMRRKNRNRSMMDARFFTQDCFGASIADVGIVREVGIDLSVGNGQPSRFAKGGFDIVSCMFAMHYSFESEDKVRQMLRNVAGALKKGGRFIGVVPNSDVCAENIQRWFKEKEAKKLKSDGQMPTESNGTAEPKEEADGLKQEGDVVKQEPNAAKQEPEIEPTSKPENGEIPTEEEGPTWGNSLYKVRFPTDPSRPLQPDGSFRPPFAWKYTYWMAEAVDVPEFVVPWEAFRAIAEGYNLEQRYRKGFMDIWNAEQGTRELMQVAERMGVVDRGDTRVKLSEEEKEAVGFYHAFCFVKV
jgi:mRNA (guanine-N7-)-methyltransferase